MSRRPRRPEKSRRRRRDGRPPRRRGAAAGVPAPGTHGDGAVLEVRNIVKHFGGINAVEGTSFTVRDRCLHALIGPNGAGKTTAFNLISGMFPPDSGDIVLAGRSIAGLPPEAITQAGIGPLVPDHQSVSGTDRRGEHPARGAGPRSVPL